MSFDHYAASDRGVARRELICSVLSKLYDAAEKRDGDTNLFLAEFSIYLFTLAVSGAAKFALFPDDHRVYIERAMHGVYTAVEGFAPDRAEYRYIMLTLAKKLLESATSKLTVDFAGWEMEKFQEKSSA